MLMMLNNKTQAIVASCSLMIVIILMAQSTLSASIVGNDDLNATRATLNNNNNTLNDDEAKANQTEKSSTDDRETKANNSKQQDATVGTDRMAPKAINIGNILSVVAAIKKATTHVNGSPRKTLTIMDQLPIINGSQAQFTTNSNNVLEEASLESPMKFMAGERGLSGQEPLQSYAQMNTKPIVQDQYSYSNEDYLRLQQLLQNRLGWLMTSHLHSAKHNNIAQQSLADDDREMELVVPRQDMNGERFLRNKRSLTVWRKMSQILGRQNQSPPPSNAATTLINNRQQQQHQQQLTNNYSNNFHNMATATITRAADDLYNDKNYYNYKTGNNLANDERQSALLNYREKRQPPLSNNNNQLIDSLIGSGGQLPVSHMLNIPQQHSIAPRYFDDTEQQQELRNNINVAIHDANSMELVGNSNQKKIDHSYESHPQIRFNNCFFNSISCFSRF